MQSSSAVLEPATTSGAATRTASHAAIDGVGEGPSICSATYAPRAKSEPWARLITSITPTMSMKPNAMRAKRSPNDNPLTTCGMRLARNSNSGSWLLDFVRRRGLVGLELAGAVGVLVLDLLRGQAGEDLEDVVPLRRLVVVGRHVDRLLDLVRGGVHVRVEVLQPVARGDLEVLELLDHLDVVGGAHALHRAQQLARGHVAVVVDVARHLDLHARVGLLVLH